MLNIIKVVSIISTLLLTPMALAADATRLEDLTVMALGPLDGRAVIKLPDGKMQVLKINDVVSGTQARVQQVLPDKLVLEETIEQPGKPTVKQIVWISKPAKAGEKSQVQRLDQEGPPKPKLQKPVTKPMNEKGK